MPRLVQTEALFDEDRGILFAKVSLCLEDTETLFRNTEALFGQTDMVYCF